METLEVSTLADIPSDEGEEQEEDLLIPAEILPKPEEKGSKCKKQGIEKLKPQVSTKATSHKFSVKSKADTKTETTASIVPRRNRRLQGLVWANNSCAFDSVVTGLHYVRLTLQDNDLPELRVIFQKALPIFHDFRKSHEWTSLFFAEGSPFTEGQYACSNDVCHFLTSPQGRQSYTATSQCLICDVEESVCRRYDALYASNPEDRSQGFLDIVSNAMSREVAPLEAPKRHVCGFEMVRRWTVHVLPKFLRIQIDIQGPRTYCTHLPGGQKVETVLRYISLTSHPDDTQISQHSVQASLYRLLRKLALYC